MLELKNISFSYDSDIVINDICLKFDAGKFYSILGPNGCGKTTLLDLIIGHLKPVSGEVLLYNKNISLMKKRDIAKQIALVSQNYTINFPFTVKEIIMMGRHPYISRFKSPSEHDEKIVDIVMKKTETDKFAQRKITDLSGGERQRCVFARAMAQDTPLLCLDEAFSNMDISRSINLLNLVKKEVREQNRTIISVFHDINLASIWSDELIFIKNGEIAALGKTDEVLNESVIEDVFHVESRVEYNSYSKAKQAYFKAEDFFGDDL